MKLIADAGSTKVDWCLTQPYAPESKRWTSAGINALMASKEELHHAFCDALTDVDSDTITAVYYYGAGCVDAQVCDKVETSLRHVLGLPEDILIEVKSDMIAAARALGGNNPAIVCILGTGSNSCVYDGHDIADQVPSMGYILGDEGSGASLGHRLLNAAFRRRLPADITEEFMKFLGMTYADVLNRVYRQPGANTYLASLVPFLQHHIDRQEIRKLVADEFRSFFNLNIMAYGSAATTLPIHIIGGVAVTFSPILTQTATLMGFTNIGQICRAPMEGLIRYHAS